MNFFYSTLIDPIFDVESIGDGLRVPRAHLEVVFTTTQRTFLPAHVRVTGHSRLTAPTTRSFASVLAAILFPHILKFPGVSATRSYA